MLQHHIAIICSSESSLEFYEALGFEVRKRIKREHDEVIWMYGSGTTLELFIAPDHPAHVDWPEAYGLRHLAFVTDEMDALYERLRKFDPEEIRDRDETRIFFVKDPDGLPIEIRE